MLTTTINVVDLMSGRTDVHALLQHLQHSRPHLHSMLMKTMTDCHYDLINPIDARRRLDYIFRNDLDILEKFSKYIPSIHADLHSEPQDIDIFELALFFRRIQNQIGKSAFHEFANVLVWYFQFGTMDWPTMHRHLMYLMRYREDLQQRFNAFLSQQHVAVCMADIAKLVEHELEESRNTSRELLWMIYKIKVKRHVDSRVFGAFYSLVSSPWLNEITGTIEIARLFRNYPALYEAYRPFIMNESLRSLRQEQVLMLCDRH